MRPDLENIFEKAPQDLELQYAMCSINLHKMIHKTIHKAIHKTIQKTTLVTYHANWAEAIYIAHFM